MEATKTRLMELFTTIATHPIDNPLVCAAVIGVFRDELKKLEPTPIKPVAYMVRYKWGNESLYWNAGQVLDRLADGDVAAVTVYTPDKTTSFSCLQWPALRTLIESITK